MKFFFELLTWNKFLFVIARKELSFGTCLHKELNSPQRVFSFKEEEKSLEVFYLHYGVTLGDL